MGADADADADADAGVNANSNASNGGGGVLEAADGAGCLLPFLDLPNHDNNTKISWDANDARVTFTTRYVRAQPPRY